MCCRTFRQQKKACNGIANRCQEQDGQTEQLNPLVQRGPAAASADGALWKDLQSAMLAVHGDLTSFPNDGASKRTKPIGMKQRSLLARSADTANERTMDKGMAHFSDRGLNSCRNVPRCPLCPFSTELFDLCHDHYGGIPSVFFPHFPCRGFAAPLCAETARRYHEPCGNHCSCQRQSLSAPVCL